MAKKDCKFWHNLEACFQLFKKKGIRSVSIQDIVRSSNISKKELYETFGNKEGVIREVMKQDLDTISDIFNNANTQGINAIHELLHVNQQLMVRYGNMNQILLFDLNKYYSEISTTQRKKKLEMNLAFITENLKRGMNEGLYREELDVSVVARLWTSKLELIQDQKWFPLHEYDLQRLTKEFIELHLRSIVTTEGLSLLNRYNEKEKIVS